MKLTRIVVTGALVALSFVVRAEEMPGMKMDAAQMEQPAAAIPVATATGTIKAIDSDRQVVTIAHGAVRELQWPPMTMGFKATPAQMATVKVGDKVNFKFQQEGAVSTIVSIDVAK